MCQAMGENTAKPVIGMWWVMVCLTEHSEGHGNRNSVSRQECGPDISVCGCAML